MLIVDRLLIGGIRFVLEKVASAVETELNDDTTLREHLLTAQMQLELGEISQPEFDAIEADVLARLREINERRTGGATGPIEFKSADGEDMRIVGAEATFLGDESGRSEE